MLSNLRFIDLCAGIGGFHIALSNVGMKCVYASEINSFARQTYQHNFLESDPQLFPDYFSTDFTKVEPTTIPDFDILCAGFPCQPFSSIGKQLGFKDTRGTVFFSIAQIIKEKQPKAFFLENVRNLISHDNGKTFATIEQVLNELGYSFHYKIIKATEFNCPQHRPRVYMVGFKKSDYNIDNFQFPEKIALTTTMSDILGGKCSRDIGYTLRVGGKGSPINDRRNWDGYLVNDKEVRLNPQTAKKMQGFPDSFYFPVSNNQAMKQIGNSVAIPVVQAIAQQIKNFL